MLPLVYLLFLIDLYEGTVTLAVKLCCISYLFFFLFSFCSLVLVLPLRCVSDTLIEKKRLFSSHKTSFMKADIVKSQLRSLYGRGNGLSSSKLYLDVRVFRDGFLKHNSHTQTTLFLNMYIILLFSLNFLLHGEKS